MKLFEPLLAGAAREKIVVAHLDAERRLLGLTEEEGGVGEVPLPIRAILADALRLGSAGLIVGHNHPSGDPTPSKADCEATRSLATTARQLGIRVHDHLVYGRGEWRSFRALRLL